MRFAYYRVSTADQSIEAQRQALGGPFDREFNDNGVSGAVMAAERAGFAKLLEQIRKGDELHVYAVDRLGRDALDVQATVRRLMRDGITVHVHGLGAISGDIGELILAVLAQVADLERRKIRERTEAGRKAARASLEATGRTHRGKESLGRPKAADAAQVIAWRREQGASIKMTAQHFGLSEATVKRYGADASVGPAPTQPSALRSRRRGPLTPP
ncbi:recombinase family protein [Phenylobacterium sp. NIBR 498073]|uniref:recombinase family protein n=1 Tax=Phenylobacterium sp. NIBR 498073 TaxID=3015177 RepID=UPI0022B4F857|nr:recombinase family protein [Phenylobacterium sp. NIBR 498073]WGU40936.1 recombinase family protein [Phenylobacterium sp. NIBR 498073]